MTRTPRFHLAFPVDDLQAARAFYVDVLGCKTGRESSRWIDFDFYGHQITAHLVVENYVAPKTTVDGDRVPVRHFGVILEWQDWHDFSAKLKISGVSFLVEPRVRFEGQAGEQATLFIEDPAGNALEFKSFQDPEFVFGK